MTTSTLCKRLRILLSAAALSLLATSCLEGNGTAIDPCAASGGSSGRRSSTEAKTPSPPATPEELQAHRDQFVQRMEAPPALPHEN